MKTTNNFRENETVKHISKIREKGSGITKLGYQLNQLKLHIYILNRFRFQSIPIQLHSQEVSIFIMSLYFSSDRKS